MSNKEKYLKICKNLIKEHNIDNIIVDSIRLDISQSIFNTYKNINIYLIAHGILTDINKQDIIKIRKNKKLLNIYNKYKYILTSNHNKLNHYHEFKNVIGLNSLPQLDFGIEVRNNLTLNYKLKKYILDNYIKNYNGQKFIFIINNYRNSTNSSINTLLEIKDILLITLDFAKNNNYLILLKERYKGLLNKLDPHFKEILNIINKNNDVIINLPPYLLTYNLYFSDIFITNNRGTSYIETIAATWKTILVQFYNKNNYLKTEDYNLIKCMNKNDLLDTLNKFNNEEYPTNEYKNNIKKYLNYWFNNYDNNSVTQIYDIIKI